MAMKLKKTFFLTITFLLFSPIILAKNVMIYRNSHGSTLNLQINSNQTLSGTFISAVASKECPQAVGMKRPIIGFIAKNALTMSISYPECGVVNLIGNIEENNQIIDTISIVAHESHHIAKEGPGARFIGHDVFHRIK